MITVHAIVLILLFTFMILLLQLHWYILIHIFCHNTTVFNHWWRLPASKCIVISNYFCCLCILSITSIISMNYIELYVFLHFFRNAVPGKSKKVRVGEEAERLWVQNPLFGRRAQSAVWVSMAYHYIHVVNC